jgi:hypothetical protein
VSLDGADQHHRKAASEGPRYDFRVLCTDVRYSLTLTCLEKSFPLAAAHIHTKRRPQVHATAEFDNMSLGTLDQKMSGRLIKRTKYFNSVLLFVSNQLLDHAR